MNNKKRDKELEAKRKKAQENLMKVAQKIIENPPEVDVEEKLGCEHNHFTKIAPKSMWMQCDDCGSVMALLDVICYRDKVDIIRDFALMIENYKEGRKK